MATTLAPRKDFNVEVSDHNLGLNLPQTAGTKLWFPMFVMSVMGFVAGFIIHVIKANQIATGGAESTIASLSHFATAVMFIGFASVFAGISFAIARILGGFRSGGGSVQEATTSGVQTLKMPTSAKVFIGLMAMGMMTILAGVVGHIIVGVQIAGGSAEALATTEQWSIWLEGVRRFGVAVYLVAIAFGLATIVTVLRFQTTRIRELTN